MRCLLLLYNLLNVLSDFESARLVFNSHTALNFSLLIDTDAAELIQAFLIILEPIKDFNQLLALFFR